MDVAEANDAAADGTAFERCAAGVGAAGRPNSSGRLDGSVIVPAWDESSTCGEFVPPVRPILCVTHALAEGRADSIPLGRAPARGASAIAGAAWGETSAGPTEFAFEIVDLPPASALWPVAESGAGF